MNKRFDSQRYTHMNQLSITNTLPLPKIFAILNKIPVASFLPQISFNALGISSIKKQQDKPTGYSHILFLDMIVHMNQTCVLQSYLSIHTYN